MKNIALLFLCFIVANVPAFAYTVSHFECQEAFIEIIKENQNLPEYRKHMDNESKCEIFLKTQLSDRITKTTAQKLAIVKECSKYVKDLCPELVKPAIQTDVLSKNYGTSSGQLQQYVASLMGYGISQTPKLLKKKAKPDDMILASSNTKQSAITKADCEKGKMPLGVLSRVWDSANKTWSEYDSRRCKITKCDTANHFIEKNNNCICDSSKNFVLSSKTNKCVCPIGFEDKGSSCKKIECDDLWQEFDPYKNMCVEKSCGANSGAKINTDTGNCECIDSENYIYDYGSQLCKPKQKQVVNTGYVGSSDPTSPIGTWEDLGKDVDNKEEKTKEEEKKKEEKAKEEKTPVVETAKNAVICGKCGAFYDDTLKDCFFIAYNQEGVHYWFKKVNFSERSFHCQDMGKYFSNTCGVVDPKLTKDGAIFLINNSGTPAKNYLTVSTIPTSWVELVTDYDERPFNLKKTLIRYFDGAGDDKIALPHDLSNCDPDIDIRHIEK